MYVCITVIDTLDYLKKESVGAREAIRWLESEFRKGNRWVVTKKVFIYCLLIFKGGSLYKMGPFFTGTGRGSFSIEKDHYQMGLAGVPYLIQSHYLLGLSGKMFVASHTWEKKTFWMFYELVVRLVKSWKGFSIFIKGDNSLFFTKTGKSKQLCCTWQ